MYKTFEINGVQHCVMVEYFVDLPTTLTDYNAFLQTPGADRQFLQLMVDNDLLTVSDFNNLIGQPIRGVMVRNGVYFEIHAYYSRYVEQYLVVGVATQMTRLINPAKKLFRFHSGGTVFESLEQSFEVNGWKEIMNLIRARDLPKGRLAIKPYGLDTRIDWLTYIVTIDGQAVGYTNHPVYVPDQQ